MNEDKMELEEARKELQERVKVLNRHIANYEKIDCKTNVYLQLVKEKEAIETVLQALKNSIPTKNIEDKYKDMKKQYEEELEKNSIKAFILKCQIEILEEVLENK